MIHEESQEAPKAQVTEEDTNALALILQALSSASSTVGQCTNTLRWHAPEAIAKAALANPALLKKALKEAQRLQGQSSQYTSSLQRLVNKYG